MFKTLDDLKKDSKNQKKDEKNKKNTESYTGGTHSGMAVQNPEDAGKFSGNYNNLLDKAKNTKLDKNLEDKQKIKITIYKNGFKLDDGPFRPINEEKNKVFMAEIEKGFVPQELIEKGYKDLVVGLENKKDEDYVEPVEEKKFQAFVGTGVSMGGSTSQAGEIQKNVQFNVDESSEITKINIRLHNGEVINQKFNLTHTVNDIYNFVQKMTNINGTFSLKEGFPPKVLSEKKKTISELKLQGSTLIQSLN